MPLFLSHDIANAQQEKLLEGLSNCRALEGIIRESFTSIKVRTSTSTLTLSLRHITLHLLTP
jgi:hypothetical protein